MKKLFAALALLLVALAAGAQAERTLYVAERTISTEQAQGIAALLEAELGEPFALRLQEETGESLDDLVMSGNAPQLAVVFAPQAGEWAKEGLLLPLEGQVVQVGRMARPLVDACVFDERLMLAPLIAYRRQMAVSRAHMEAAGMGYLLDGRAHPVWYPSEFMQALDELAMLGAPGMAVWPPREGETLYMEALLQSVSGMRLADAETGAYAAEAEDLEDTLEWLEDMLRAGLIGAAEDREEALERFLCGETAIFPDWTATDSAAHDEEIEQEEIMILPYPSLDGMQLRAVELVIVCAFDGGDAQESALLRRAVSVITGESAQQILGPRGMLDDGARWLPLLAMLDYGPTLRSLLSQAACGVILGEADAGEAARSIDRAMRTMGR